MMRPNTWKLILSRMLPVRKLNYGFRPLTVVLFLCAALIPAPLLAGDPMTYSLGVFPHLPPRDLEKVFAPLAGDLGKAVDRKILLTSSTTFNKFSANLDEAKYDIAFVQPFDYIRAADMHGYLPIASRQEKLSAVIVVKKHTGINSLADLRGKKLALPPASAAVSRLIRAYLRAHGIDPDHDIKLNHYRTHFSCMQQVMIGEAVACGTASPARRYFEGKYKVSLPVIAHTREIPHALWIIHKRVSRKDREIIRNRILGWANSEEGRKLLANGRLTPFVRVTNSDYNIVRKIAAKASSK